MGLRDHNSGQIALVLIGSLVSTFACDPFIYREGIQVRCISAQNSRTGLDCYDRSRQIPAGTIARYGCDSPLYLSVIGEDGLRSRDEERILTCNSHGKWSGGLARFYSYHCILNCGVTNLGSTKAFVQGGDVSQQSDWPWHATIFARDRSTDTEFKYKCGGTLAKPHGAKEFIVVTAAHCVAWGRYATRNVNDVRVVLGTEQPRLGGIENHSPDAQVFHPREFVVHGSYDGHRSDYQSDIALIRLEEPIRVTQNIVPVCLSKWAGKPSVGDTGHIAGFGYFNETLRNISQYIRRASFPIVDPDRCSAWRVRKLNIQEYCAGMDNLQNACNGDSGGGMVFNGTDEYNRERFYLHGIVSHGRGEWNGKPAACDTYTVYTRLRPYMDWIAEIVDSFEDGKTHESLNAETQTTATEGRPSEPPTQAVPSTPAPVRIPIPATKTPHLIAFPETNRTTVPDQQSPASERMCPRLLGTAKEKEGIRFQCKGPRSSIPLTGRDCSDKPQPSGTKLLQTCLPYYKAGSRISFSEMICGADGYWVREGAYFTCVVECGIAKTPLIGHIVNGTATESSNWPWNAALFVKKNNKFLYACGATLITSRSLVTAAHCVEMVKSKLDDIRAVLAPISSKFSVNQNYPHAQIMQIEQIHLHERFSLEHFDADIAILKTTKRAQMNGHVYPACFPFPGRENEQIERFQTSPGSMGVFVGFGTDGQFELSETLKAVRLPVVSDRVCSKVLDIFPTVTQLCAGYTNGISVCNGDSGGGLLFQEEDARKLYFLQGIASHGQTGDDPRLCDSNRYSIFTRVGAFKEWVERLVATD